MKKMSKAINYTKCAYAKCTNKVIGQITADPIEDEFEVFPYCEQHKKEIIHSIVTGYKKLPTQKPRFIITRQNKKRG